MNWQGLVAFFSHYFNNYAKKYLVQAILKTIGVSSSVWTSIVSFFLTKVYVYFKDQAEHAARLKDQEKIDQEINKKYQDQIKNNAPEADLIQSEQDILNGGRR